MPSAPYYDMVMWPGADGIRVPAEAVGSKGTPSGTLRLVKSVSHDYGAAHADWVLSPSEACGSELVVTNANAGANAVFPVGQQPGFMFVVYNNSGQIVTFKVSGQTGVAVANAKRAILVCEVTDIARVTADT